MDALLEKHLFTVNEFHQMGVAGIFTEDDRVELINGDVVQMTPIGRKHAGILNWLIDFFSDYKKDRFLLSIQNPLLIDEHTEVQPDLLLLYPKSDFYTSSHPKPNDVILLIEVCDSSIEYDRIIKIPLYAKATIQEVWLIDLENKTIEISQDSDGTSYKTSTIINQQQMISPKAYPDIRLHLKEIFCLL